MYRGAFFSGLINISVYFNKKWFLNRSIDLKKKKKDFKIVLQDSGIRATIC